MYVKLCLSYCVCVYFSQKRPFFGGAVCKKQGDSYKADLNLVLRIEATTPLRFFKGAKI